MFERRDDPALNVTFDFIKTTYIREGKRRIDFSARVRGIISIGT